MHKGRLKEVQIITILREQEAGIATAEVCRRARDFVSGILNLQIEMGRARVSLRSKKLQYDVS